MHKFVDRLEAEVAPSRELLLSAPLFRQLRDGTLTRAHYARYLIEAYHYAKHTPRLLAAAAAKLRDDNQALMVRLLQNATEEEGHERWALLDLEALGYQPARVAGSEPLPATDALVAYTYYVINYLDPVSILGPNYALETLGSSAASGVAAALKATLGVSDAAVRFISGHGEADQHHVVELRRVTEAHVTSEALQRLVIRSAKVVYAQYAAMLASIWETVNCAATTGVEGD